MVLILLKRSEPPKVKTESFFELLKLMLNFQSFEKNNLSILPLPFFLQKCIMHKGYGIFVLGDNFYILFILSLPFYHANENS